MRSRGLLIVLLGLALVGLWNQPARAQGGPHLGYGVTPASSLDPGIEAMGFDWARSFSIPFERLEHRVLVRLNANDGTLDDLPAWGAELEEMARSAAARVEAYEIGNEPNLDDSFAWGAPPDAADYAAVLCEAYDHIKRADPSAMVVSAGLAPTGRIPFEWNGHRGYCAPGIEWCPKYYQDEREFLREMLEAGAGACFDALGYHPYGFNAPADAPPGSPACGPNDFCFRGVEPLHQIMVNEFQVEKPVWATEFGWILDPRSVGREECWEDPAFLPFQWMVVSEEEQASNLREAFEWAGEQWPWMGPMFVFNYGYYGASCNQVGFFDIKGRPAEAALTTLPKQYVPARAAWSDNVTLTSNVERPAPQQGAFTVQSLTYDALQWEAEAPSAPSWLRLKYVAGPAMQPVLFTADPEGLPLGAHQATVELEARTPYAAPVPVEGGEVERTITLRVETLWQLLFPLSAK